MLTRPVDSTGDILPVSNLSQLLSGKEAVAQAINLRLNFYHGEWWEDRELGFRVPDFLIRSVRSGELAMLANYIASYVNETLGVRGVKDVEITKDHHSVSFRCTAITNEGKNTTVEVDLDGLV